jgi:hypothetical protein
VTLQLVRATPPSPATACCAAKILVSGSEAAAPRALEAVARQVRRLMEDVTVGRHRRRRRRARLPVAGKTGTVRKHTTGSYFDDRQIRVHRWCRPNPRLVGS